MDPRQIIDQRPMSPVQIAAVATTVGLNALDGFDVLAISFAAPGIAREWGVDQAALGIVLSMELIGMALGSIALGGIADRIGRRPTLLACLVVMAIGMVGATLSHSVIELSAWRVFTGLGIGGMIPCLNALASEYANARWRRICLSLMVIGYPLGAIVGGSVSAALLSGGDWRNVFLFGAAATVLFIPLVAFFAPESPAHLAARQPPDALARINRTFKRMGHPAAEALPEPERRARSPLTALFSPALVATTLLVTFGYFAHILTFYFVAKWLPKLVVDMGFHPSQAAGVLVWMSVGGAIGGVLWGIVAQRFSLKRTTIAALLFSMVMLIIFGGGQADLAGLSLIAAVAGFVLQGGIVGLYTILAEAFPTPVRASGTGFVIGVGRGGALLAPIVAGFLFQAGMGLQFVSILMGAGSLIAAGAILMLRLAPKPATA
jgi:benzoate transport